MKRLVVIGAGAIGGSVATLVQHSGFPTAIVARPTHADLYREQGLSVVFPHQQIQAAPLIAAAVSDVDWQDGDVVLITTKLNDAIGVIDELADATNELSFSVPVVCGFNGVAGESWATQRFEQVMGMMIWMPSTHMGPGDFRVYGKECLGVLDVGVVRGDCKAAGKALAKILRDAGFDSVYRDDIMRWKHAKWITNLGNTAQALVTDDWRQIAKLAQSEGEAVMDAAGIDRVATAELLQRCKCLSLAPIDGQRREGGSTWQSLKRGKPLETPWIEGAIAELAKANEANAPMNAMLTELAVLRQTINATELLDKIP